MGIMSGSSTAPEVVVDQEKMREFEERLTQEKEEIRLKSEQERQNIEQQANLKEEEKMKLLEVKN